MAPRCFGCDGRDLRPCANEYECETEPEGMTCRSCKVAANWMPCCLCDRLLCRVCCTTDRGEEQLAVCCGRGRLTREERICNSCRDHRRFECETCGEETCEVAERKLGGCVACQTPAVRTDLLAFERMRAMAADGGGLGAALDAWRCNALVRAVQVREKRQTQPKRKREEEEQAGASSLDAAAEDDNTPSVPSFEPGSQQKKTKARKELVLSALNTLFDSSVEEEEQEVPKHALQQQLQRASPRFTDAELEAALTELEEDNHIMYRDGVIHRI